MRIARDGGAHVLEELQVFPTHAPQPLAPALTLRSRLSHPPP